MKHRNDYRVGDEWRAGKCPPWTVTDVSDDGTAHLRREGSIDDYAYASWTATLVSRTDWRAGDRVALKAAQADTATVTRLRSSGVELRYDTECGGFEGSADTGYLVPAPPCPACASAAGHCGGHGEAREEPASCSDCGTTHSLVVSEGHERCAKCEFKHRRDAVASADSHEKHQDLHAEFVRRLSREIGADHYVGVDFGFTPSPYHAPPPAEYVPVASARRPYVSEREFSGDRDLPAMEQAQGRMCRRCGDFPALYSVVSKAWACTARCDVPGPPSKPPVDTHGVDYVDMHCRDATDVPLDERLAAARWAR